MATPASRTLILIRHAHRSKILGRERDNGLSRKGRAQVQALLRYFRRRRWPKGTEFWTSPARRCRETLAPLAKARKAALIELPGLQETPNPRAAAKALLRLWKRSRGSHVLVSGHGDLLPAIVALATGVEITCKKGSWTELTYSQGRFQLKKVLSELS